MKEETKDAASPSAKMPSEAQMNEMYGNERLNFYADAQKAKQDLNRRYARMVNTFGSYKQMPDGVKDILKEDYNAHEAKWGENGTEIMKRFGSQESGAAKQQPQTDERTLQKQDILERIQRGRKQPTHSMEYER